MTIMRKRRRSKDLNINIDNKRRRKINLKSTSGLSFYEKESRVNGGLIMEIGTYVFWTVAMALLAFVFIYCFGIRTSVVGVSMQPTLYHGEEILIDRFSYFFSAPKSGDVVVFLPNGNENTHYYVKRVIGVPGDTVLIENGIIYVNEEFYEDKSLYDKIEDGGIAETGIVLGEDEFFVLGDNRNNSEDSRSSNIGVVRREYIIGKAWMHLKYGDQQLGLIK